MQQDDYISVAEAADILGLTTRQTRRYKSHVRSTFAGKRLLFHRGDVTALAAQKRTELQERLEELGTHRQLPKQTKHRHSELAAYLREQVADQKLYTERLNQQLIQAAHRIGELEAQLARRFVPDETSELKQQLGDVQKEKEQLLIERDSVKGQYDLLQQQYATLEQELTRLKLPWWKRFWRT